MQQLFDDLVLFIPICLVISFVYAAIRRDGAAEIARTGIKNFGYFTVVVVLITLGLRVFLALSLG